MRRRIFNKKKCELLFYSFDDPWTQSSYPVHFTLEFYISFSHFLYFKFFNLRKRRIVDQRCVVHWWKFSQCIEELNEEKNGNAQETFRFLPSFSLWRCCCCCCFLFCFFFSVDVVNSYGWNKIVRSSVSSQTDDATHKNRFFCLSQLCGEEKKWVQDKERRGEEENTNTYAYSSSVSSRFRADRKRNNCIREDSREEKCVARLYSRIASTGEASARMRVWLMFLSSYTSSWCWLTFVYETARDGVRGFCELI